MPSFVSEPSPLAPAAARGGKARRAAALAVALVGALAVGGCASYHARSAPPEVVVGRERPANVRVTMRDGRTLYVREPALHVEPAGGDTVLTGLAFDGGRGRSVPAALPLRDVASVSVWTPDNRRTAVLIGGLSLTFAALSAILTWAFSGEQT